MKTISFLLLIMLLGFGCAQKGAIPSYVYIEKIALAGTDPNTQAALPETKIIDAWVYVNDQLIGGFRLPASIPILNEGVNKVEILAGVAENGGFATPAIYPFYERYTKQVNFVSGKTDTLKPIVTYTTSARPVTDGFEGTTVYNDDLDGDIATRIVPTSSDPLSGSGYGKITLSTDHPSLVAASIGRYDRSQLRAAGAPVWIEINWRGDNSLAVGIIGRKAGVSVPFSQYQKKVILTPRATWGKAYISLYSELAAMDSKVDEYQIVISSYLDPDKAAGTVYLDNVKVVY